jgi:hypothetical protein
MSRRIPRPINEFSAAHSRQATNARIQAIEGRTITDDAANGVAGSIAGRWDITQYKTTNVLLTNSDWSDVFTVIQQDSQFRDGDEVFFPSQTYEFAGVGLVVTRSCKLTGSSPTLTSAINTKLIDIQASWVSVEGFILQGLTPDTYSGSSYGIYSTSASYETGHRFINIERCQIFNISGVAVQLENASNVVVRDSYIKSYARGGVMGMSPLRWLVENCTIEDARNGAGNPSNNTYPIAFTRFNNVSLEAQPRAKDCVARGNYIIDNPWWEGIDTHGGEQIVVENNFLYNVSQPIAMVSSNNASNVDTYAPKGFVVRGNYMNSMRSDGAYNAGIMIDGAGTGTAGVFTDLATGIVSDNIIIGYGKQSVTTNQGGIVFKYTDGLIVKGNYVDEPSPYGIYIGNDNYSYVVADNLIRDVWSTVNTAPTAINAPTFYHEGFVHGNKLTRGTKVAAFVNVRGITVANNTTPATHNSRLVLGWNDFDSATTPIQPPLNMNNPGGILKLVTFISPAFTERPAVPPTVLSGASTMADTTAVVSAIRAALKDKYGLVV